MVRTVIVKHSAVKHVIQTQFWGGSGKINGVWGDPHCHRARYNSKHDRQNLGGH